MEENWGASLSADSFILHFLLREKRLMEEKYRLLQHPSQQAKPTLLSQNTSLSSWSLVETCTVLLLTNWHVSSLNSYWQILYSLWSYPSLFHYHPHLLHVPALPTLILSFSVFLRGQLVPLRRGQREASARSYSQGNKLLPREVLLSLLSALINTSAHLPSQNTGWPILDALPGFGCLS